MTQNVILQYTYQIKNILRSCNNNTWIFVINKESWKSWTECSPSEVKHIWTDVPRLIIFNISAGLISLIVGKPFLKI